jgi:hypothetical protein
VDKTYIRVAGKWRCLYRAGATIDFWFSAERDAAAAKHFYERALKAREDALAPLPHLCQIIADLAHLDDRETKEQ